MADLPINFGPAKFASIPFHERHTLAGEGETFEVDPAVAKCLPPGSKIIEGIPWGASAWTTTSKLRVEEADGTEKSYFMKAAKERGAIMMEGEFNSLTEINKACPGFAPQVKLCQKLVEMHQNSESPTGKFGFPLATCHGKHIQPNDWDESWCRFFTRLITIFFETDVEVNGPWKEYEEAFQVLKTKVIPKILEPLQSDGRVLKPSLVHGDLWEENTGIDVETGNPVVFDASVFYAHNEYELGMWRREVIRIGSPHIKQYLRRFPPSEPVKQWDDRNLLYCIKFALAHSSGWTGSTATRETIFKDMQFLIQKYSEGENSEAFNKNQGLAQTSVPMDTGAEKTGEVPQRASRPENLATSIESK